MVNMLGEAPLARLGSWPHRALERQLASSPTGLAAYRRMLLSAAPGSEDSKEQWENLADAARVIAGILLNVPPVKENDAFLNWIPPIINNNGMLDESPPGPNTYRVLAGNRRIDVQLSSIHAVKGETHFATLLLETFNYKHALKSLFPWLLGERQGSRAAGGDRPVGTRDLRRLRMNYVALTRSTHVICLAVPAKSLRAVPEIASIASQLEAQGWRIVKIPPRGLVKTSPEGAEPSQVSSK